MSLREVTSNGITMREAILRAIEKHGPNYGLGLWELLRSDGFDVSGDIYSVLRSLERGGLLASHDGDHGMDVRGGRPRRYYELTNEGRAWLQKRKMA